MSHLILLGPPGAQLVSDDLVIAVILEKIAEMGARRARGCAASLRRLMTGR